MRQVAERLGVSTAWVYRQVEAGALGHVRVGQNQIRLTAADLEGYLARFPGIGAPAAHAEPEPAAAPAPRQRARNGAA